MKFLRVSKAKYPEIFILRGFFFGAIDESLSKYPNSKKTPVP